MIRLFEVWADKNPCLLVVSDLGDININMLCLDTQIYLYRDILVPELVLLDIIRILRSELQKSL